MNETPTKTVKLIGGPLHERTITVPRDCESTRIGRGVGFWTYEFAGREQKTELFAIRSNTRRTRRLTRAYIELKGHHPLYVATLGRTDPVRNATQPRSFRKRGRGAAKRMEAHGTRQA